MGDRDGKMGRSYGNGGGDGEDPGFSNRGGATNHTHMSAWLRFCVATASFSHHLLYIMTTAG